MRDRRSRQMVLMSCALFACGACASMRGASTLVQSRGSRVGRATASNAQEDPQIQPDRPDVTNASYTVPKGLAQLETGAQRSRVSQSGQSAATPISLRVGLAHWFEARIDTDGVTREKAGGAAAETDTQFGGATVGGKFRLWAPARGAPVVAIMPGVTLPWGRSGGGTDAMLRVITGGDLSSRVHLDVNYAVAAIADGNGHVVQHLASASTNASIGDRWNPYVEVYWFSKSAEDARPNVSIDTGFIFTLKPRLAIDGGVAFGVTAAANGPAVFGGLSMILGEVKGHRGVYARLREAQMRGDR